MRLLLRYSSSPALPPRTALLCNGISLCFPLSVLGWVLQGFFCLFCASPGFFHSAGSLGASLQAGPMAWTCSGWLASPGSAPVSRLRWGHPTDVTGSGDDFGACAEITACSLPMPSRQLRDAPRSLVLPSIPSKILMQTGA